MAHIHDVVDVDPNFTVNADTRIVTDQSPVGTTLMQYDHNSERLTFDAPKTVDKHDMSLCDRIEIHYINIGTNGKRNPGVYLVDDLKIKDGDSEKVEFTWLVSNNATSLNGTLSFVLRFVCTKDGVVDYIWNTAICNTITIGTGMDNGEAIVTEYADILGSWYNTFLSASADGVDKIENATQAAIREITEAARVLIKDLAVDTVMEDVKKEIDAEKTNVINTIHDQADDIADLVLDKLPSVVSPTVEITAINGGHRVTITDTNGPKTFEVYNGTSSGSGGSLTPEQLALLEKLSKWFDNENYETLTCTLNMNPSITTYEIGSSQEVLFSWTFNKVPVEVTFNGLPQDAAKEGTDTVIITSSSNGSRTCTLYGKYTETETVTKSVTIKFRNKYYYGCAAQPNSVDSAFVKSLPTSYWAESKTISFNPVCNAGEYVWYAYPKRLGAAQMWQGGFQGGFDSPISVTVTNNFGVKEDYYVYRSINSGIGEIAVEAK